MNEEYLEQECDAPDYWDDNAIFERDGKGRIIEAIIPDDIEEVMAGDVDN